MNRPIKAMNVFVAPASTAEKNLRGQAENNGVHSEVIAPGISPTPQHDLINRGGKTIPHLSYINFYVGGTDSWNKEDIDNIDKALEAAMADEHLNNVMVQYFNEPITSTFKGSKILKGTAPVSVSKGDVEAIVSKLYFEGELKENDFGSTVFNFMLPSGTVLTTDDATTSNGGQTQLEDHKGNHPLADTDDAADSLDGLGGYHGSVHFKKPNDERDTVYYAIGVYSEVRADGWRNGIPVFDHSWKNVVATFYHELQEARTDPDVEEANMTGDTSLLGWVSNKGEECGDFPVFEVNGMLTKVFKEVPLADGSGTVPVQLQYSNAVHGPEGPISTPHVNTH
ncbi:hypothetical protein ACFVXR_20825 [Bacillus thuringiensis]|uniref:hypothetical protein n=1 Tax=Bacillus thuringiensis TaxID=1428 RepID=UPI000BFDD465|nr:hypothetical protein [Bacillus thuringiensis]PGX85318.1 hypothetical protein COE45_05650 [Bacillus thuringiensis]